MGVSRREFLLSAAAGLAATTVPAFSETAAEFYQGKTVTILVGSPPGGGYDTYARMIAPVLAQKMGAQVIIENRPGGGGLLALNVLNTSRPDGLTLMHASAEGAIMSQLTGREGARWDVSKLNWLARTASEAKIWYLPPNSPIKTIADAQAAESIRWSATGPADNISDVAAVISHALGLKSEVITGYKGSQDMSLAVINGEVDSGVGSGSSILSLIKSGDVRPLAIISKERWSALPDLPTIYESAELNNEQRWWLETRERIGEPQRAMVTGPDVPEDRVAFLREKMQETLTDTALVEEGKKTNREISFVPGEELQSTVSDLMTSIEGDRLAEFRKVLLETYF